MSACSCQETSLHTDALPKMIGKGNAAKWKKQKWNKNNSRNSKKIKAKMKLEPIVGINPKCLFLQRDISNEIDLDKYKAQGEKKYRIRKENNHKMHVQSRKMGSITSIYVKNNCTIVCA